MTVYKKYKESVLGHIKRFNPGLPGLFRGKEYSHILYLNPNQNKTKLTKDKCDVIREYSLLTCNKGFPLENNNLNQYAHHLNSSQIMCFNFFGPQIDDNHKCNRALVDLIFELIKFKVKNAKCEFEKVFHDDWIWYDNGKKKDEGTNFDFYIIENRKNREFRIPN